MVPLRIYPSFNHVIPKNKRIRREPFLFFRNYTYTTLSGKALFASSPVSLWRG